MKMYTTLILSWLILVSSFDVVSVKPSSNLVGPDYNNQLTFSPSGITGKNVTLKRLIAVPRSAALDILTIPARRAWDSGAAVPS